MENEKEKSELETENSQMTSEKNLNKSDGMGVTAISKSDTGEKTEMLLKNLSTSVTSSEAKATAVDSASASDSASDSASESVISLEDELAKARKDAEEYLDLARRSRAELINYRKRVEREIEEYKKYAIESLLLELIPAIESIEQAIKSIEDSPTVNDSIVDGLKKISAQFASILEGYRVKIFGAVGDKFDPNLHEPIKSSTSHEVEYETVDEVFQRGVKIADRVVKPALVSILTPAKEEGKEEESLGIGAGEENG